MLETPISTDVATGRRAHAAQVDTPMSSIGGPSDGAAAGPVEPIGPWPPPPVRRRRRRGLGAVLILVVGAAAATGGAAGWVAGRASGETTASSASTVDAVATSTQVSDSGLDVASIVDLNASSVVEINTTVNYRQGPFRMEGSGAGTGIVLTSDGLVLTNAHVIADATSITVKLPGIDRTFEATVVGSDADADVAVIQVQGAEGLVPATFGSSEDVAVGDDVVVMGNALDLGDTMSVSRGIVSALDRTITTSDGTLDGLIQTDAAISSGDSGGALFDAEGRVIGMNSAGATDGSGVSVENIGFAIPIDTVRSIAAGWGVAVG